MEKLINWKLVIETAFESHGIVFKEWLDDERQRGGRSIYYMAFLKKKGGQTIKDFRINITESEKDGSTDQDFIDFGRFKFVQNCIANSVDLYEFHIKNS